MTDIIQSPDESTQAENGKRAPTPIYYTFGNHMHWVDMEWLWGNDTLSGSVDDMLAYAADSGSKGQINFDGIGYEKLVVQAPAVIARLREAIDAGTIEVAGASYGQPYGLFQGGESNVRQRVYGARTVRRLFGVWPQTFWEEEFDFFPQLPQILAEVGFRYAALFFQWTWHTPHIPIEEVPAIWWEAMDGSRLLTAPRNDLNLHQWPEEFVELLQNPSLRARPMPLILQWLELMPSPDWMCRSELILPPMRALLDNPDFEVRFACLPEYLEAAKEHAVTRRYTLDDVFHGVSLGKNGDLFPRLSRTAEQSALTAESIAALAGFFGRPYPNWDVYPTWELEEAWRELLSAQHHDNHECEGLCGYVGRRSFERSLGLSGHVIERTANLIAQRTNGTPNRLVVFNPLGWERGAVVEDPASGKMLRVENIPAFGYRVVEPEEHSALSNGVQVHQDGDSVTLRRGPLSVTVDRRRGTVRQITSPEFPTGALPEGATIGDMCMVRGKQPDCFTTVQVSITGEPEQPAIEITRIGRDEARVKVGVRIAADIEAIDLHYQSEDLPRPDPWLESALHTTLTAAVDDFRITHDHPYGVSEIRAEGHYLRKYPTGDWMTSPQVFETVENPFTALQFLDFHDDQRGLLFLHDGSQAYLRRGSDIIQVLSMYDAWDEDYFVNRLDAWVRIVPHGAITNAQSWRAAQEFNRPILSISCGKRIKRLTPLSAGFAGELPAAFGGPMCSAPGIALTAFYREMEEAGQDVRGDPTAAAGYAGRGMAYPYVLRLVELDGKDEKVEVRLPGRVEKAFLTDLLGRVKEQLEVECSEASENRYAEFSLVRLSMRAHEIATLYLDLELGRKVYRDLDAERGVWAAIHKVEV